MSLFAVIFPLGREWKRTEEKRREEEENKRRAEKTREETRKNCEGCAPYATTQNFDICRGGAGRLMHGRGVLWAGHL